MRKWIADRIKDIGKSQTKVANELGLTQSRVAEMVAGRRQLKSTEIADFARALDIPEDQANTFFQTGRLETEDNQAPIPVQQIRVEGVSQAGMFRDISLIEDDEYSREVLAAPKDDRFPHAHQYALKVSGDSMNLRYPDGGYVVCAAWQDTGLELKDGHAIHVERIRFASERETTIKIYREIDDKRWLYPDSTNKNHQPIEINGDTDIEIIIKGIILATYSKQVI